MNTLYPTILKNVRTGVSQKRKSERGKSLTGTSKSKDLFGEEVVSLNSIVKIKMHKSNSIFKVKLTTSTSSEQKSNGVQLINHKKPLADSIKGKKVGDKVKIKNTDNYVEILEINSELLTCKRKNNYL